VEKRFYVFRFRFSYCFIVSLCVCLRSYTIFYTSMARYSLFLLKVPLNNNQPTNLLTWQTDRRTDTRNW